MVNVTLLLLTQHLSCKDQKIHGIEASAPRTAAEKADLLRTGEVLSVEQAAQLRNPDRRIALEEATGEILLSKYADGVHGLGTKDSPRFFRCFWEVIAKGEDWEFVQTTVEESKPWGGLELIVYWEKGNGVLHDLGQKGWAVLAGRMAWRKPGIAISQMRELPAALYSGEIFDKNVAVVSPRNPVHLPALWAFCSSPEFHDAVRRIDQKLNVTNATLVKVPFDIARWQRVADEMGPLPEPHSDDPTQWLFKGNIIDSTAPLQVTVARLLSYRWPEQSNDDLDHFCDADGIVCIPAVRGEKPAADQSRELLAAAYGPDWSPAIQEELLAAAGFSGKTLENWLRDGFFDQHCKLFHQRPFIWHIWDGRRDGFSALVNYHTLDRRQLEKLTYTYLGDWIKRQEDSLARDEGGAEARLLAARELQNKLKLILDGEPPYDLFVRWKPIEQQPLGWEPDLNDGVRLNIRPFVTADVLRKRPSIHWGKDRGKNPPGAPWGEERINDRHLTLAEKQAVR